MLLPEIAARFECAADRHPSRASSHHEVASVTRRRIVQILRAADANTVVEL